MNGNNQLYVVAIELGDSKNNDSWEWFMMKLYDIISDALELVIIFIRCTSIERVVISIKSVVIKSVRLSSNKKYYFVLVL